MRMPLNDIFNQVQSEDHFDAIRIGLASPEKIHSWSYGEVKKPETINYRTQKPERDGLFCAKIFGPVKDYECLCGKYKRLKNRGVICEKCGVEVTLAKVRRERMGHIDLASPVAHIWFLKSLPSRMGMVLDIPLRDIERVLYFEAYIVVDPGLSTLERGQLLSEEDFIAATTEFGDDFVAMMGAEAIGELLRTIDIDQEVERLRTELRETSSEAKIKKFAKRLKVLEGFQRSGIKPEWMIMTVLPVLPPDLRPLVALDGGRFATSDLNDLYRRVINRNNRLKRLLEIKAPDIIVRNEKRMLQEAVDSLLDNGRRGKAMTGANKRPLKSLADMIKGKSGRFRQNLLGKRVDYSGRSVITVGPELRLHQCGLPKLMALELFKPFIFNKLVLRGLAVTPKAAKKMVENQDPVVWDILEEVIYEHPVMLNRAPTLHRLGIQAFEPKLIEGKALQLHPLVCAAFNADFDGDQMAVHVPLSLEAQMEARALMLASNNILSPASGKPIATPSHDMVLGINFITTIKDGDIGEGSIFGSKEEALVALEYGKLSLHAKIKVRGLNVIAEPGLDPKDEGNASKWKDFTSVGRIIFNQVMPKGWNYINKTVDKKVLAALVDECYKSKEYGRYAAVQLLDNIMKMGYHYATLSGLSISVADMTIPSAKQKYIADAKKQVAQIQAQADAGIITEGERYNKVIDIWTRVTDDVGSELFKEMKKFEDSKYDPTNKEHSGQRFNSVYMMADSGARGSRQQVRQLAGMRGLMAKPQKKLTGGQGEIIENPITANFREGLSVLEYFISTHGGRKGLSDTALKTADAGYLTRRLVDVAHNVVITEEDCGTHNGIVVKSLMSGEDMVEPIEERILGRTSLEDVVVKTPDGKDLTIIKEGDLITLEQSKLVKQYGVESVRIRSVLTCEAPFGVCARCYGLSLATATKSNPGDSVGIIAAQSIGEPGTQLTLRTFHIGGTASRVLARSQAVAEVSGKVTFKDMKLITDRFDKKICISRNGSIFVEAGNGTIKEYKIQYGAAVYTADKAHAEKGTLLAEWDPHSIPVLAEVTGTVKLSDVVEGITLQEERNKVTGVIERKIIASRMGKKNPRISIEGKGSKMNLPLPIDTILMVESGEEVEPGDILAKIAREAGSTKDITGGLPRIAELFEARRPRNPAIIAEFEGIVSLETSPKGLIEVVVRNEETNQVKQYSIPQGKHLVVYEGDHVGVGEALTDGAIDPHDVLRVKGDKEAQEFLLNAIQEVYRLQGVTINDRHIEVIVRQMLGNVKILDAGDTAFLKGEIRSKASWLRENAKMKAAGKNMADAETILLGISKASLASESFISAASFQETTKVLTDAAITGQVDELQGLKENVIVGHLIPAGTGISARQIAEEFEEKRKETGEK